MLLNLVLLAHSSLYVCEVVLFYHLYKKVCNESMKRGNSIFKLEKKKRLKWSWWQMLYFFVYKCHAYAHMHINTNIWYSDRIRISFSRFNFIFCKYCRKSWATAENLHAPNLDKVTKLFILFSWLMFKAYLCIKEFIRLPYSLSKCRISLLELWLHMFRFLYTFDVWMDQSIPLIKVRFTRWTS